MFLPYKCMAASLVMWPGPFEQNFFMYLFISLTTYQILLHRRQ